MELDIHFYGIYSLARSAGCNPDSAHTIAYSAQFINDAIDDRGIVLRNGAIVKPLITSHKPLEHRDPTAEDQWKVLVPFHFLPGLKKTARSFYGKLACSKGTQSLPAKKILEHALIYKLDPFGAHLAGIAAHVYADTFSNYGFVGLSCDWNKAKHGSVMPSKSHTARIKKYILSKFEINMLRISGTVADSIPYGHVAVGDYPNRPYLKWQYVPKNSRKATNRDNQSDYLKACELLYDFFIDFLRDNKSHGKPDNRGFNGIRKTIEGILKKEERLPERIRHWEKAIASNALFQSTGKDKKVKYSEYDWEPHRIKHHLEMFGSLDNCHSYFFIEAAYKHRNYVLNKLLIDVLPEDLEKEIVDSKAPQQRLQDVKEELTGRKSEVFICYARVDEKFVLKLVRKLKNHGVKIWFDKHIKTGDDWDTAIDNALYRCDEFLIILSKTAVQSKEVRAELRVALDERKKIVPVLYQECNIPRQLRIRQHIDLATDDMNEKEKLDFFLEEFDNRREIS